MAVLTSSLIPLKLGYERAALIHLIVQGLTLRRRYSEFASFREALVRLYPTLIIPPIPEKHTVGMYLILFFVNGVDVA